MLFTEDSAALLNLVAIRRVYHGLLDTGIEPAGPRNCG
jgi:hypothetical protein